MASPANPIVIITNVIDASTININFLEWHPNSINDDLLVLDGLSNILWKVRAVTACADSESDGILIKDLNRLGVQGLNISIDSGTLYIHKL